MLDFFIDGLLMHLKNNRMEIFRLRNIFMVFCLSFFYFNNITGQTTNIRFRITNTQNQPIKNSIIAVTNKNNEIIKENFFFDSISKNYFVPSSLLLKKDSGIFVRVESNGYWSYDVPLARLTRDTLIKTIKLIKMEQAYYNSVSLSYSLNYSIESNPMTVKIPYSLDSFCVIVGITKYGLTHFSKLKKIIKRVGLQLNDSDVTQSNSEWIISSGVRLTKVNDQKFSSFNCRELDKLRSCKKMIYVAGPKIMRENYTDTYFLFTNKIYVKIKPEKENEFKELIKTENLKILNKYGPNNDPYYILESNNNVGEGINTIAKKLLQSEIITLAHPVTKNLYPRPKGQAPF